jgi:alanine racemase
MTRATRATIDLGALSHNLNLVRKSAAQSKVMAVIKANAYGHGIIDIARHLHAAKKGADAFGVATVEEAIVLREAGIGKPIVLLEGFNHPDELQFVRAYDLECVFHNAYQLELLKHYRGAQIQAWLKIDTGMHRLGFAPAEYAEAYQRLQASDKIKQDIILMTHLSCADERENDFSHQQIDIFNQTVAQKAEKSIANSAAILAWPASHTDWVRPGIMLYGVSPFEGQIAEELGLRPVMHLQSKIIAIQHRKKGERIGYGASYTCTNDMPVGVVAMGYGDGYPRHAPSGTPVLINGCVVPLVGRVSMDMITVDLRKCKNAKIGDTVTLWGQGLPVEKIAQHADTIAYELLCKITSRVEFEYSS